MLLLMLMLPLVLIPLVGLAIDGTMCFIVQAKLSAAVDGAALGAGRLLGTNANTTEIYGALTYLNYTFKYNRSMGNFLGNLNSSGSQYFDLSAAIDLTNGFTLTPHIGRQLIPNQALHGDYSDIALTLSKDFGNGLVATVAALTTNADRTFYTDTRGRYLGNGTVTVGLKYSF